MTQKSAILWQEGPVDGVPEPAIAIEFYNDCIQLNQKGQRININYDYVKEFCKFLKDATPPK